MFKML